MKQNEKITTIAEEGCLKLYFKICLYCRFICKLTRFSGMISVTTDSMLWNSRRCLPRHHRYASQKPKSPKSQVAEEGHEDAQTQNSLKHHAMHHRQTQPNLARLEHQSTRKQKPHTASSRQDRTHPSSASTTPRPWPSSCLRCGNWPLCSPPRA